MSNVKETLTSEMIQSLISNGVIRENTIQLVKGFDGEFDVIDVDMQTRKSFVTDEEFESPVFTLNNSETRFKIWASSLFNAIVLDEASIDCDKLENKADLPIYFRDDFQKSYPNPKRLAHFTNEEGGFDVQDTYRIIGAIVARSRVDDTRWALGHRHYLKGHLFLEFERQLTGNSKFNWITEQRIHEIANMSVKERTFESKLGKVTLPSLKELKVIANSDKDPRYASAQFILVKTW